MRISSLEDTINDQNPVRFIDSFVETLDLEKVGFLHKTLKTEGRPSFESKVFLKMYLYNLTLQRATGITHACHGNFSGAKLQEIMNNIFFFYCCKLIFSPEMKIQLPSLYLLPIDFLF